VADAEALQPPRGAWRERAFLWLAGRALSHIEKGRIVLAAPGGARRAFTGVVPGREVHVGLARYRGLWRLATRGKLGFAEAFMDGDIEVSDLQALFHLVLDNEGAVVKAGPMLAGASRGDRSYHRSRENTRTGSRRNISEHYDLGNAFYRLWLDEGMTYSSGIQASADTSLEAAQALKIERIIAALELDAGQSLLEIGCGWGSFAEAAARRGASVTGITLSQEQLAWARERIAAAGLHKQVSLELTDYRDVTGAFDRIASIEMIEAVGEANWPVYFETVRDRLVPGGVGVIQAITIPERYYDGYRRTPDFIQRYIFPGGMLPTIEAMEGRAREAGLDFEVVERFGASYALTLDAWRKRFNASWPQIRQLGFDERFRRMWDYYLAYCAAGFEREAIDVGLYRVRRPG
jgi:cyclopropane-fatty-acyl-phospholipid synthase